MRSVRDQGWYPPARGTHNLGNSDLEKLPDTFTQAKLFKELIMRKFPIPPETFLHNNRRLALYLCNVARFLMRKHPLPGAAAPPPHPAEELKELNPAA